MFSNSVDILSSAVNNLYACRQHVARSRVPSVWRQWSTMEYPVTCHHQPYGERAPPLQGVGSLVLFTPSSLPLDTARPWGLAALFLFCFCPASKRRGAKCAVELSYYRTGLCVCGICQTDSCFCTFHLVNAEMLVIVRAPRWQMSSSRETKCTLNIDNRLLKKKMIVVGVLFCYFASPI